MSTYLNDDALPDWNLYVAPGWHYPEIGGRCVVWNTGTVSRAIYKGHRLFYECDDQWRDNGFTLKGVTKWRLPREGE